MAKHLVLVGGGHAHLATLADAGALTARGHRVTLVSAEPEHDSSDMAPGVLAGRYRPAAIRFPVAELAKRGGGHFVAGRVAGIDVARRRLTLADGSSLDYDLASFDIGSVVAALPGEADAGRVWPVKPVANLVRLNERIAALPTGSECNLLVIGGGPAGVEAACALTELVADRRLAGQVTLAAGGTLLARAPGPLRSRIRELLASRGVEVLERVRIDAIAGRLAMAGDGRRLPFDHAVVAAGVRPPGLFRDAGLEVGALDGGLLVNRFLQAVGHPELFGGGDCICFGERPLDKVGAYAVRQGEVLRRNLLAALEGKELRAFRPRRRYLLLYDLGRGQAALHWGGFGLAGAWALQLKERLDFRFMKRFTRPPRSSEVHPQGAR